MNSSATTASISDVEIKMKKVVNGSIVSFDELAKSTDWNTVEKVSTSLALIYIVAHETLVSQVGKRSEGKARRSTSACLHR